MIDRSSVCRFAAILARRAVARLGGRFADHIGACLRTAWMLARKRVLVATAAAAVAAVTPAIAAQEPAMTEQTAADAAFDRALAAMDAQNARNFAEADAIRARSAAFLRGVEMASGPSPETTAAIARMERRRATFEELRNHRTRIWASAEVMATLREAYAAVIGQECPVGASEYCMELGRADTFRLQALTTAWAAAGVDLERRVPYAPPAPKPAPAPAPVAAPAPAKPSGWAHRILKEASATAPATVTVDGRTLSLTGYGKSWRIDSEDCCVHGLGPWVERVRYAYYA